MPDLMPGEQTTMQGSGRNPYILKNTGGVYSCSCPAWRNQHEPIEKRTCKHLKKLRGDREEAERLSGKVPVAAPVAKKHVATAFSRLDALDLDSDEEAPAETVADDVPLIIMPDDPADALKVLLAHSWDGVTDPTGWLMSEKLDGVRSYWDGTNFKSRLNNIFHAPDWYKRGLEQHDLDGEFWMGRGRFQETSGYARRQDQGEYWRDIKFMVFDAPTFLGGFERRMEAVKSLKLRNPTSMITVVDQVVCRGMAHLQAFLNEVEDRGGEGLMLRQAGSEYERGRSMTLLKVKNFFDAEAVVTGYTKGKGRHRGVVGAMECRITKNTPVTIRRKTVIIRVGTTFQVGTGLSDKQRRDPPRVGSWITFRAQELTNDGIPRFPSFIGVRDYE